MSKTLLKKRANKQKLNLFEGIRDRLVDYYGSENIKAILAYGTRINNNSLIDQYSDYDVTIIFNNYPNKPLPVLPKGSNITTLFLPDIRNDGLKNFRLDTHGLFYIYVLASSCVLFGSNPFIKLINKLSNEDVLQSLKDQILLHCVKLSRIAIDNNSNLYIRNIRKYSFRISQNFYFLLTNKVGYAEFIDLPYEGWIKIFDQKTKMSKDIINFLKDLIKGNKEIKEVLEFTRLIKSEMFKIYGKN